MSTRPSRAARTVFVPLKADDPLVTLGPDGKPNTGDEAPAEPALHGADPGPEPARPATASSATPDDIQNANNTDSPWVDQSQTYTSHASHQVFLRDYDMVAARRSPTASCWAESSTTTRARLTRTRPCYNDGNATDGSISTWAAVKQQAAQKLGLLLKDKDVTDIPMLATDPYGEFIPGPNGLPQYAAQGRGRTARGQPRQPGPGARERACTSTRRS